jgi:hypothetical protein
LWGGFFQSIGIARDFGVQQPVVYPQAFTSSVQAPAQPPIVDYKGTPCYFINGNYYPAVPMK